jgi:UDP-N-acetylglucosamine 2-epimerase (non-hydrolysing)/GDP/UDP-N,N'-diacetylbacillosamine 2-epimerase (hydrolysing)
MKLANARSHRTICFVTGTRAEFGLMQSTLRAIQSHPSLRLQLIVTGMHLDRTHGRSLDAIRDSGWNVDRVIPWRRGTSQTETAIETGRATANLAKAFAALQSEIVLVVGDRVEAFAAASAAHISGRIVAHVHGGDRALGLVDDALRHSITKLAHLHFPATAQSARRIARLGEDRWRIHPVGSPGLDDLSGAKPWRAIITHFPALRRRKYALLALHPSSAEAGAQRLAAEVLLTAVERAGIRQAIVIYPNNDPGADGIIACWKQAERACRDGWRFCRNLPRMLYLGLLRDAAMLVGNSSSGIIEAASFGTPVIDIGQRQLGRERGENVKNVACDPAAVNRALKRVWNEGNAQRFPAGNLYGTGAAGKAIAARLAHIEPDCYVRKLIKY